MAQKRMIDKKISVSEQVANLPLEAQLIFTWSIPHADDLGLLPASLRTLKALVVPMMDISLESFGNQMESIVSQGLVSVYELKGDKYYRIRKFLKNQTLKKDRKPNTYLKDIDSWEQVESLGFQMEDIGNPSKEKLSKEKLSKSVEPTVQPFDWKEYLKGMQSDNRNSIRLIASFFKKRGIYFETKEQAQIAIRRHVKAANQVVKFGPVDVNKAMDKCAQVHKDIDWSLETVLKKLTN